MKKWKIAYLVAFSFLMIGLAKYLVNNIVITDAYKRSDYIYADDNVADDEVALAINYVDTLPKDLKSYFTDKGWKIKITSNLRGSIAGSTHLIDKTVYIKTGYVSQVL